MRREVCLRKSMYERAKVSFLFSWIHHSDHRLCYCCYFLFINTKYISNKFNKRQLVQFQWLFHDGLLFFTKQPQKRSNPAINIQHAWDDSYITHTMYKYFRFFVSVDRYIWKKYIQLNFAITDPRVTETQQ